MDAEEYLKGLNEHDPVFELAEEYEYTEEQLINFAERYHQKQLKLLRITQHFDSENELRDYIENHIPIGVKPKRPSKTTYVAPFTNNNARIEVINAIVKCLLNSKGYVVVAKLKNRSMIEKIDQIKELLIVPSVDKYPELAINQMKILKLLVELRAEAEQCNVPNVVRSGKIDSINTEFTKAIKIFAKACNSYLNSKEHKAMIEIFKKAGAIG